MPTFLVVDDSAVDRRLVGGLLEQQDGWTIEYAENGRKALQHMTQSIPDIVITDLQMPDMNGLDLVRSIRVHHADIPVILMTAHGSESLAVEALEQGATSYVPKSQLADKLAGTIEQVLALVHADRSYERLVECMLRNEFTFELQNDVALIDPLVDLVQQMVVGLGLCDGSGRIRVGMALEQALLNALYRGNLELSSEQLQQARESLLLENGTDLVAQRQSQAPFCDRKLFVDVRISRQEARFVVRDEGPGFDTKVVPERRDAGALEREGGRGLVLMRSFMDEVTFNERGNEVTMVKRCESSDRGE